MNLGLTVPPELLRRLKTTADANGMELNALIVGMLTQTSAMWGTDRVRRTTGNEPSGYVLNRMYKRQKENHGKA